MSIFLYNNYYFYTLALNMCSNPQLTPVDARAPHNATRLLSLIVTSATRSENCADVRRDHTS